MPLHDPQYNSACYAVMLIPRISYLAALEPVWFHSVLEPFPMEDRSQEQLELNVFKKTTVSLDHMIKHYSVQLELNWLCVFCRIMSSTG